MCFASTPEQPKPAPFFPIDIQDTGRQAEQADIQSFNLSDEDFVRRFPGLARGREGAIAKGYQELTGPLDPTVQASFVNEGLAKTFNSLGGGSPGANITGAGSAGRKAISSDVAGNVQAKQDYDRDYFINLLNQNQPRSFGLSGSDAANLSIANTGNLNAVSQSNYVGQVQAKNAEDATSAANTQAAISTALAILGVVVAFSDKRLKKNVESKGKSPYLGIPIKEFSYKGSDDRFVGALAQDVEKVMPEAVVENSKGMKSVIYGMTDVPFYKKK